MDDEAERARKASSLGNVEPRGSTRYFSDAQVRKLEHIAAFRLMGFRLSEAAPFVRDDQDHTLAERRRLWALAGKKAAQIHRDLSAWIYVTGLLDSEGEPSQSDAA